ncbi:hypothetical protein ES702_01033 [subsurface metagenome]
MQETKTNRNITRTIRIPKDLDQQIRQVSKEENCTIGTAIKFLIERAKNDNFKKKFDQMQGTLDAVADYVNNLQYQWTVFLDLAVGRKEAKKFADVVKVYPSKHLAKKTKKAVKLK